VLAEATGSDSLLNVGLDMESGPYGMRKTDPFAVVLFAAPGDVFFFDFVVFFAMVSIWRGEEQVCNEKGLSLRSKVQSLISKRLLYYLLEDVLYGLL
jgi:hypothetical protein